LIYSQDSPKLFKLLHRKGSISLHGEKTAVMSAIGVYVRQSLDKYEMRSLLSTIPMPMLKR
jgi:hypothetical protein